MGPRLTAEQGIELIKIHQLRRENAAIYQQLQALRDAVSDVKDEHEVFRERTHESNKEIVTIKTSLSEKQRLYKKVGADVEMLIQSRDEMKDRLEESTKETKKYQESIDERQDKLVKTVKDVQVEIKAFEEKRKEASMELNTAMSKMQGELAHKAEAVDLDTLRDDLIDIRTRSANDLGPHNKTETVLVQRSAEEEEIPLETIRLQSAGNFTQHIYRISRASSPDSLFGDPDKITETASYDESEAANDPSPDLVARAHSMSEIDLDQNIESARHLSPNDSLVTIPNIQHTEEPDTVDRPSKSGQNAVESLLSYPPWERQTINPSTVGTERLEAQQLADRVVGTDLRALLIRWLQINNWNWDGLRRSLGGLNPPSFSQSEISKLQQTTSEQIGFHSEVAKSPVSGSEQFVPRTPHKNVSRRQDICNQKTSSASPLIGKVLYKRRRHIAHEQHAFLDTSPMHANTNEDLEVQMPSIDYTPVLPSPYNPRPRLVSKRRLTSMNTRRVDIDTQPVRIERVEQVSKQPRPEDVSTRIPTRGEAKVEKNQKRKKRRVIPPAPAIPILSTSSEADKERFNTWFSP